MSTHVDTLIIGWGKAGKTLAGNLGRAGRSVALIEQSSSMIGGTCINIACVPSKSLIHSAEMRPKDSDLAAYFQESVTTRDSLTAKMRAKNYSMLDAVDQVMLVSGTARFVDPHTVEVTAGEDRLTFSADSIVINTGSDPRVPAGLAVTARSGGRVHDSQTLQHVDPLPNHLVIVGGGYVGLEFASMFGQFGSKVTVLDRQERSLHKEDPDVSAHVVTALSDAGVTIIQGASVSEVSESEEIATVRYAANGTEKTIEAAAVLLALGRTATTAGLGLDLAGVQLDKSGNIVVDEHLRTNVPHIYAAGDVKGGSLFTYVSLDDSRILSGVLLGNNARSTQNRTELPYTLFTSPPLARAGITESQAQKLGLDYLVAVKPVAEIAAMPRPKIVGEPRGVVKFVVDAKTDLVLGAALMFVDAQETINTVALAMHHGITAATLRDTIYTHPSSTECLNEVLAGLAHPTA